MNEGALSFDAALFLACKWSWWMEWNCCSWNLFHYPTASVSVGCRLRNGGQEAEKNGLIIPFWVLHQIHNSAWCQLSWFCQVTVISLPQRQHGQDSARGVICVVSAYTVSCWESDWQNCHFSPSLWNVSCQSLLNHSWLFSLYSKTQLGSVKGGLSVRVM